MGPGKSPARSLIFFFFFEREREKERKVVCCNSLITLCVYFFLCNNIDLQASMRMIEKSAQHQKTMFCIMTLRRPGLTPCYPQVVTAQASYRRRELVVFVASSILVYCLLGSHMQLRTKPARHLQRATHLVFLV